MSEAVRSIWTERYRVPSFPSSVVLLLLIVFALFTFTQGYSLAFDDTPTASQQVMHALADLFVWGSALMVGALYLLFALTLRLKVFVWTAYVYLTALHLCLTIMIGQATADWKDVSLSAAGLFWYGVFVILSMPFRNGRERV